MKPAGRGAACGLHSAAGMRFILTLGLCLSLLATGVARAEPRIDLTPHDKAFRRARAEIIAGSIFTAISAAAAIVTAIFTWISVDKCSHTEGDCDIAFAVMAFSTGLGSFVDGVVGLPLLLDGIFRRADAGRLTVAPILGPGTVGGGVQLRF